MKLSLFLSTMLLGCLSFAATGVRVFDVQNAKMDPDLNLTGAGSVTLDYDKKEVSLTFERRMPPCPEHKACIMMMPAPMQITLPIVSVKTDGCNLNTVVASQDQRPVDGIFQSFTLLDATNPKCMFFAPVVQNATFVTQGYNRLEGTEFKTKSTMTLMNAGPTQTSKRSFVLAAGTGTDGNIEGKEAVEGSLQMKGSTVSLTATFQAACPQDAMCKLAPPVKITLSELQILDVKESDCGDLIIAERSMNSTDATIVQRVEITDYSKSTCEILIPHVLKVKLSKTWNDFSGKVFTSGADLWFDNAK